MYMAIKSNKDVVYLGRRIEDLSECLMLFTMNQCPFCVMLKPTWHEVMGERKDVDTLEIDSNMYRRLLSTYPEFFKSIAVSGFPTIAYKSGSTVTIFDGPRTKQNIIDFIDGSNGQNKSGGSKSKTGIYVRGPKRGKLKKGFKFVDGRPTKVK